jgi:hypothetical protein
MSRVVHGTASAATSNVSRPFERVKGGVFAREATAYRCCFSIFFSRRRRASEMQKPQQRCGMRMLAAVFSLEKRDFTYLLRMAGMMPL